MRTARRTCAACREEADRSELVRLARAPDGSVIVDYRGNLPGRGGWVHPLRACVDRLEKKPGMLSRALKGPVRPFPLLEPLLDHVNRSVADGISMAAAGGALVGGHDQLRAALLANEISIVAVANDASERTIKSLGEAANDEVALVVIPLGKGTLGGICGQAPRAAVGATRGDAADYVVRQLRRLRDLG